MKKILLLLTLFCALFSTAKASEVTIADGTSKSSNVPAYGLYADTQGSRAQSLYPADSLTDLVGASISSMTFYLETPAAEAWTGTFVVSVGTTETASLSSGFVSDDELEAVYTGLVDATQSTLTIDFAAPFLYTGGNLVIDFYVSVAGNYKSAYFYCASLTGAGRYRNNATAAGTAVAYLPKVTFEYTSSGSGPTCDRPTSVTVTDLGARSVSLTWEGGSGTYDVGYKGPGEDDYTYYERNTTATSHTFTGLQPNTSYSFAVKSKCAEGESNPRTVNAKTAIAIPYEVNFDALSSFPSELKRYSGLYVDSTMTATRTSTTSGWTFTSSTTGVFESKHMYCTIAYSTNRYWVELPSIQMEGNAVLTFMMALSTSTTSYLPVTADAQPDDRFLVLASVDEGATWTPLRKWDNTADAEYVFDNIATNGEEVSIDLSAYAGQNVLIAFYGESTVSNKTNYLHIDDVVIDFGRACLKPTGLHEVAGKATKSSVQLEWDDATAAAWSVQYKKSADSDWTTVAAAEHPFTLTGLDAFTEYNVRVAALCDASDQTSLTRYCKEISVKTSTGVPYHEGFSTYSLPSDWKRYDASLDAVVNGGEELVSVTSGWASASRTGSYANGIFPDSLYHLYLNIAGDACHKWIVSPTIEIDPGYELSFDLALTLSAGGAVTAGAQDDDMFAVLVFDGDDWNTAAEWSSTGAGYAYDEINATPSGQTIKVNLAAYAGKNVQIAFYGESSVENGNNNLHISNVSIDLIPACAPALSLSFDNVVATTAQALWTTDAPGTWQYGYVANPADDFVPADSLFNLQTTATSVALEGLQPTTKYAFFVRRACDEASSDALVRYFTTMQIPAELPYSNNFETENGWLLINGECKNQWIWGTAAGSVNGGTKALYVTDSLASDNAYVHKASMIYATKTFNFDEPGTYSFSFDWKGAGEGNYDYIRVALVPAETELEASTDILSGLSYSALPNGWVALDGGTKLNLQSEWQHHAEEIAINQVGVKKLVIAWRNDGSGGTEAPAGAIDNFSISRMACPTPTGLEVTEFQIENAQIEWEDDNDKSWVYACLPDTVAEPEGADMTPVNVNSLILSDLTEKTTYVFYLRKFCGEDTYSESTRISFTTLPKPFALPFVEDFNDLTSGIPAFWDNSEGTMTTASYRWNYYDTGYEGKGLRMNSYNTSSGLYSVLATPKIALTEPAMLSFMWKNPTGGSAEIFLERQDGERISLKNSGLTGIAAWQSFEINLNDYTGDTVRIIFKGISNYGNGDAYLYLDDVKVEALPACMKPTALVAVDTLLATTSAALDWTAGLNETNWLIRYKKVADEEWTLVADSVLAHPFTLTGLESSTVYEAQVAAWCDINDSTAISEFTSSVTFATLCEPWSIADKGNYTEGFETYEGMNYSATNGVVPACWDAVADGSVAPHVIGTGSYLYIHEGTKALTFYGSGNCYAAMPEFAEPLNTLRISFWAAWENVSKGTLTLGYITADDQATFHPLASYQGTTGQVMEKFVADLDSISADAARLVFRWYYDTQYSCCIDDVEVMPIPSCLEPNGLAANEESATINSIELSWTPQGNEANWLIQYKKATADEWIYVADSVNTNPFTVTGLDASNTYNFRIAAWCNTADSASASPFSNAISAATACGIVDAFPYAENFDAMTGATGSHVLPLCWNYINTCSSTSYNYYPTVYPSASYAASGTNSMKFYSYYSSSVVPQDQIAILPQMENINTLRMNFNARKYSASATYYADFVVGVMSDPEDASTFVPVKSFEPASTEYEACEVRFNTYTGEGQYIAIKLPAATSSQTYRGIYLDDVLVRPLPNCLEPEDFHVTLTAGVGTVADLAWVAGTASAWTVEYGTDAEFAAATVENVTEPSLALTDLTAEATYYARVKAICSETEESEWVTISFVPTSAITINDGTTTNSYVPLYGSYVDEFTASQFIVPAEELANIVWDSITSLTFYTSASTATAGWEGAEFDVYVAPTTATSISSLVSWTSMDKVMNSAHLEVADNKMVVNFDAPYQYAGGSLLIGVKLSEIGTYSSVSWLGKSQTGAAMYTYTSYGSNYTNSSAFAPKMTIAHIHGEAPSCLKVQDIAISGLTASSAIVSWTNGDEDQNAWQIVCSTDANVDLLSATPINVTANPYEITGLEASTTYYIYVRANCGDEDGFSEWSAVKSFTTASLCQMPSDIAADDITINSASISWNTYGQTGFNLRYGTDGTNWTVVTGAQMPYVLTGLTASTNYCVQVQAACAAEDENSWTNTFVFKTAYGIPFEEKFASSPADWTQAKGLMSDILAGGEFTSGTVWYFGTANGVFDDHARINIYGTDRKHWLMTPNVFVQGNVQLTFDLALTKYSGTLAEITKTLGQDDKFVVLASTDDGETWTILREWNNTGSEYVYNNIAYTAAGEPVAINLSAYDGQNVKIAFYGESTVSETNSDNNLHIDNVSIDIVPTCLKPSNFAVADIKAHSAELSWTAGEEGQTAWQIAYDTLPSNNPDTLTIINVSENPYVLTGLDPETHYYVYVRANCGDQDGVSRWADPATFVTTVACPAPTGLKATITPGNGSIATLNWNAGDAQAWQVEYSLNSDMTDSLVLNVTEPVANLTDLTAEATYYARVKADCGDLDGISLYSAVISFVPTDKYELIVNDGTATNTFVPIEGSYVDEGTRSQFIIPEADLAAIEWDSITALTFYGSFTNESRTTWGAAEFAVYMYEAPEATMSELVDWTTTMTEVMASGSLALVDGKMVINLDAPYQYQGGNLMIGIYQTTNGTWANVNWLGASASGASFGGHGNAVSQRNFLPKMNITYVPGVAPACPNPKQLAVSNITDSEATFSWKAVEGATWEYALVEGAAAPESFEQTDLNSITINELAEATNYTFYLRRECGLDGNSEVISVAFTTEAHVAAIPFNDDFEGDNYWKFVADGQTNAWMVGNDASNGGVKALYVSNNGASYAYDNETETATFATILINFDETGDYTIDYDWMAEGEYDDEELYDYMRVALVPAATAITAGMAELPADAIALDQDVVAEGVAALYDSDAWIHVRKVFNIPAADYKLVVAWFNDEGNADAFAESIPGAIDNIVIIKGDAITDIQSGAGIDGKAVKFFRDNQVYIRINGAVYNITGQRVE